MARAPAFPPITKVTVGPPRVSRICCSLMLFPSDLLTLISLPRRNPSSKSIPFASCTTIPIRNSLSPFKASNIFPKATNFPDDATRYSASLGSGNSAFASGGVIIKYGCVAISEHVFINPFILSTASSDASAGLIQNS